MLSPTFWAFQETVHSTDYLLILQKFTDCLYDEQLHEYKHVIYVLIRLGAEIQFQIRTKSKMPRVSWTRGS